MDNRNSVNGYYSTRRYVKEMSPVVEFEDELVEDSKKPVDSLLELVYSKDERTGLPTGDLGYLVNDKANPQVKQFILDNLMRDVSAAANPSVPDGMSDELAFSLMREKDESYSDYIDRLNRTIEQDKWIMKEYAKQKQDVSSKSGGASVSAQ